MVQVISFMTMSIITAVVCSVMLIIAASAAGVVESDVSNCSKHSRPLRKAYSLKPALNICDNVRKIFFSNIYLVKL